MTTQPRPFQFSLRSIFIVTTLVAIVCSGLFAGPTWATALTLYILGMLTPVAITVAAIYGRGYLRTFSIGALFPCFPVLLIAAYLFLGVLFGAISSGRLDPGLGSSPLTREARLGVAIVIGAMAVVIFMSGLFAMLVRWLVERAQRPGPVAATGDGSAGNRGEEPDGVG